MSVEFNNFVTYRVRRKAKLKSSESRGRPVVVTGLLLTVYTTPCKGLTIAAAGRGGMLRNGVSAVFQCSLVGNKREVS
jgi:hypothetical protein